MTKGDKLFCYTCKAISFDTAEPPDFRNPNTKPSTSRQDSRFNPKWNYRCAFCHGFKVINVSQFLDEGHTESFLLLDAGKNPETLKAYGRELKAKRLIRGFKVIPVGRGKYKLFERVRTKKALLYKAFRLRE